MRHRVSHRKLGRVTEHRIALLRNQAQALLRFERIETTVPKAKELRPFVERIITIAKRGLASEANGRSLHARRLVLRDIADRDVVAKLFDTIAPRFETRPGGYTRILRLGYRRGDSAEVAQIELVGSEYDPNAEVEKTEAPAAKPKGVGGRLRAAAQRLRGKKAEPAEGEAEADTRKAKPAREKGKGGRADTRGKGLKTSAPRKAGGS
jgi:large subunit ribosomal protein L17